jgi:hypothetical protein
VTAPGSAAGPTSEYHFHGPLVEAVDARSVANLLQENNNVVCKLVERYVKNNPSVIRRMVDARNQLDYRAISAICGAHKV